MTFLALASDAAFACLLALTGWRWRRRAALPGLSLLLAGLAATPLALATGTLAVTLAWPMTPRWMLVGWPLPVAAGGLAALGAAPWREVAAAARFAALAVALPACAALGVLAANASHATMGHDALVYLNEARAFAAAPSWATYLAMVNPSDPYALVAGHSHTWLYPTFLAQALAASGADLPGPPEDFVARLAGQLNLALMFAAAAAWAWAASNRRSLITFAATAAIAFIPTLPYVTTSESIDAFRTLPLLLLALALIGPLDRRGPWIAAAALLSLAVAAHTLNACFAPLLVACRAAAGLTRPQWKALLTVFVPAATIALLPVALFYLHLWRATGHLLGNGLHYIFYKGSPLEVVAAQSEMLGFNQPTLKTIWQVLWTQHGLLFTLGPLLAAPACLRGGRGAVGAAARMLAWFFIAVWSLILAGTIPGLPSTVSQVFLGNFRYLFPVWVMGVLMVAAGVASWVDLARPAASPEAPRRALRHAAIAAVALASASWIWLRWSRTAPPERFLREGEWRVVEEIDRSVKPGEHWMTDRRTVAYYAHSPGLFLYTPAGRPWLLERDADAAWRRLCAERVRVVALANLDANWWPATALHAALTAPGHSRVIESPMWRIYVVNLPDGA